MQQEQLFSIFCCEKVMQDMILPIYFDVPLKVAEITGQSSCTY